MSTSHVTSIRTAIACYESLLRVFTPKEAISWLEAPHPQLGGRTPLQCLAAGDGEHVQQIVALLVDGASA